MLSRLNEAEKNPDKGWKTLPQHNNDYDVQEDEVMLLDTGVQSTKRSPKSFKSPLEYKCKSLKIPLKNSVPKSTVPSAKSVSPTGSCNDSVNAMGFESSFNSKRSCKKSPSLRGNSEDEQIRLRLVRQQGLSLTSNRQNCTKKMNTESSRSRKQEQPFDTEIEMLRNNVNHSHFDDVQDKNSSDKVDKNTKESDYENKETTDNDSQEDEDLTPTKRHFLPSSKVTPRPSLHAHSEQDSNKSSFYGSSRTIKTYQISRTNFSGAKKLTKLYNDDKKRKLSNDEDMNDSSEQPSPKKSTIGKKNTRKRRGKSSAQSPEVSLVEIISSDEEDKTECKQSISDNSVTGSTTNITTPNNKSKQNKSLNDCSGAKGNATLKDNPFERDNFTTEILIGPRVFLGSLQGIAKGPLEITVNQLKWKMEYKEQEKNIFVSPCDFTSLKIHIDKEPKIIVLGVAQRLALRLRQKYNGNGKFLDPGSLVPSEGEIVLEIDDILGPETVVDLAEWTKDTHGKEFQELSFTDAQAIMERFTQPVIKSQHYNTRSSSSSRKSSSVTPTKLLIYPPPPLQGAITVTSADLECLAEGEFLNDVIIDFYLNYLYYDMLNEKDKERTHIFSSFFYKRMTQKMSNDTVDSPTLSSQHRLHNKVKKWTRNVDIFSKDFIIVPINESSHWFLAIICYPQLDDEILEEEILSDDSVVDVEATDKDSDSEDFVKNTKKGSSKNKQPVIKARPCILIFDSLGSSGRARVTANLRSYLSCEWKEKKQEQPSKEFTKDTIRGTFPKVPNQDNHCDCGVFLLQYVESFFQDPIKDFRYPIDKVNWFTQSKVASKRQEIKDLILCLSQTPEELPGNQ